MKFSEAMNMEHDHDDEGGDDDDDDSLEIPVSFCLLALMTLFVLPISVWNAIRWG